jgi:hypothetical protein
LVQEPLLMDSPLWIYHQELWSWRRHSSALKSEHSMINLRLSHGSNFRWTLNVNLTQVWVL